MDYSAICNPRTYGMVDTLHELLSHMRKNDPVTYIETEGFRPFWAIAKHAHIIEIERQHEIFVNAPRALLLSEKAENAAAESGVALRSLIHMDEPDHKAFRNLTQDWFMPQNLKQVAEHVRQIAHTTIDKMFADGCQCDFVNDVAIWYPLRVIMMILGVPEKDEALMLKLTQELFGADDPDMQRKGQKKEENKQDRMQTLLEFFNYFTQMTKDRRENPGNDVASVIANATIDGEPIGELEAMSYYVIIATAGHDTTSSSTAGLLLALLQNPEQMQKLRDNPSLMPLAIDEAIRWTTPVKHFMRTATQDYTLGEKLIKKGDSMMLLYASANRDETVFDAPFEFRVERRPNKHLAFGHDAHHCLGHILAKMEMRLLFEVLFERTDEIQLSGEPAWVQSSFVSGLKTLPISFRKK